MLQTAGINSLLICKENIILTNFKLSVCGDSETLFLKRSRSAAVEAGCGDFILNRRKWYTFIIHVKILV